MFKRIVSVIQNPSFILATILVLSFYAHLFNIGYNSPSNDEAIYIKTGVDAIFKGQSALYNTASWFGGHPYVYPTFTAIAYSIGGIYGSRILNVTFSTICLFFISKLTFEITLNLTKDKKLSQIASLIASVLIGFSAVMHYVSRLATMDMPSFTFFVGSLYFLIKGVNTNKRDKVAKNFLISSLLIISAFAFKYIIAIYIPIIFLTLFFYTKQTGKNYLKKLLLIYFAIPIICLISIITFSQIPYMVKYIEVQTSRDPGSFRELTRIFLIETWPSYVLWAAGAILLIARKQWRLLILAVSFSIVIAIFHFATLRVATWDKHLFLTVLPIGIMSAIGLANTINHKIWGPILVLLLIVYAITSSYFAQRYNSIWPNYSNAFKFLSQNLKEDDTLLAEESSSILLPNRVTTFDWFNYKGQTGFTAYRLALMDGYFDYIELSEGYTDQTKAYKQMEVIVSNQSRGSYDQVYKDKYFTIYKLKF